MNLDILLHLIDVLPPANHSLLNVIGRTCQRAQAQAQAVRRAALLSRVDAAYHATLLHSEASLSDWPHRKGNGKLAAHVSEDLKASQRLLFEYLTWTYGLTSRLQCSTPLREWSRVVGEKILRLYDVQVKAHMKRQARVPHEMAEILISDLAFLSRRGYETQIFYYLYSATEQQTASVLRNAFLQELRKSNHVTLKELIYRTPRIRRTLEFRFERVPPPHLDSVSQAP
jgi:hypothetical protein